MQPTKLSPAVQQLPAQQNYSYLQALGIKLWVPRLQLPNAAPSPQCLWQNKTPAPVVQVAQAQPLPEVEPKVVVQLEAAPAVQPQPVVQAEPELAPLSLSVWQLANSWQLILPPQLSASALNLLTNLLHALHPQTLGITKQLTFNWPLPNLPSKLTKEEAAFSLQAFLSGANFNQHKPEGCIIFVSEVEPLLPWLNTQQAQHFYLAPSLEVLLKQPQLKADFWQKSHTNGLLANFKGSWVD